MGGVVVQNAGGETVWELAVQGPDKDTDGGTRGWWEGEVGCRNDDGLWGGGV